jgi:two-component system sensor histidine kinase BarA
VGGARHEETALMAETRHLDVEPEADVVKLKALVVDDQELNRRVMNILLREFGCCATLATSGEEAIEYASAATFDVIFMDLNMPGLDGDETARRIRAAGASKHTFIVRWTTESAAWLDPGLYDGQAPKPITVQALAQLVSETSRRRCNRASRGCLGVRNISRI